MRNFKNTSHTSRKGSLSELKSVIRQVNCKQYENKVKVLEHSRSSRSPRVPRKNYIPKSNSMIIDDSYNKFASVKDINITNVTYKKPDYLLKENPCCKKIKNEVELLQKKISDMEKENESLINRLKKGYEHEKMLEINMISKFYIEKIKNSEINFESELKKHVEEECEKLKKKFEIELVEKIKKINETNELEKKKFGKENENFSKVLQMSYEDNDKIENKFRVALEATKSEYERKFQIQFQENQSLRKENIQLSQRILEIQSKFEAYNLTANEKDSESSYLIVLNKKYNDLLKNYNTLKDTSEKLGPQNYCGKCKKFISTDSEISNKISRLREFLSN